MLAEIAEPMGPKIRRLRLRMALTQDELARRAGMSKPYLSLIETGRLANPPSDEKLRNLEQVLVLPAGELVCLAYLQRTPPEIQEMLFGRGAARPEAKNGEARHPRRTVNSNAPLLKGAALLPGPVDWPDVADRKAYAARVCDDSMLPGFSRNEIVVFSPAHPPAAGDDCFVRLTDGRTTFHRVFFESDAIIRLQPRNQRYGATLVTAAEVQSMHKAVFKYQRIERERRWNSEF